MSVLVLSRKATVFGPESNGILMTPQEFDRADFDDGWRFELINGVLVVSPLPLLNEVDPNEDLGFLLRYYQEFHPQGTALDATFAERIVRTGKNRRRADRVIWAGLGRNPRRGEVPTIVVEFASGRKRDRKRDYETKRQEYLGSGVKEYWLFDRFHHSLTVFSKGQKKIRTQIYQKNQIYQTDLLPGFELPLDRLFAKANKWGKDQPE